MLFNSGNFAIFFPVVFALYWMLNGNLRVQNLLLLVASYFFYATWDFRFLFLLMFSTVVDFASGFAIWTAQTQQRKKLWLTISIVINLGFLGFFKYYNFFVDSFVSMLSGVGVESDIWTLSIVLPVGISFYTFHGLSYVIDIYYKRISPEKNFIDYSLFVSYFPLLVAGPIERATHLLPQLKMPRRFDYTNAVEGSRQILWGLFKKVVIADNCAVFANDIFGNSGNENGATLMLGAVFFAFQIYGDFSGYSDIALGVSRLLGIQLLRNFAFPYFSRDIAEFWRRWHISLSSWFKDYVYIPLGGSKVGKWKQVRNTFIIFLLSGFWHGANWTYVVWGGLNALYIMPLVLKGSNRSNLEIVAQGRSLPTLREFFQVALTFLLTTFAWIFFRAESLQQAFEIVGTIFTSPLATPSISQRAYLILILVFLFLIVEWIGRERRFALETMFHLDSRIIRWSHYMVIILLIFLFGAFSGFSEFIYFQF